VIQAKSSAILCALGDESAEDFLWQC
jgi:hypothetical protein